MNPANNLLVPLWKLNPAGKDGEIDLLADAPRNRYNEIRSGDRSEVFIEAVFEVNDERAESLANIAEASSDQVREVSVSRRFDGKYLVRFPLDEPRAYSFNG